MHTTTTLTSQRTYLRYRQLRGVSNITRLETQRHEADEAVWSWGLSSEPLYYPASQKHYQLFFLLYYLFPVVKTIYFHTCYVSNSHHY